MPYRYKRDKNHGIPPQVNKYMPDTNWCETPYRIGERVESWAVGMCIAPRKTETYETTIHSFFNGGWSEEELTLFVEPEVDLTPEISSIPNIIYRPEKFQAWNNFYLGFKHLVHNNPDVDAYVMLQDDVLFCKGTKLFLENMLWPHEDTGVCSTYAPTHYTQKMFNGFFDVKVGGTLWGALTFIFPPDAARAFLKYKRAANWTGKANVDTLVGRWTRDTKYKAFFMSPSLSQHIGHTSAIWSNRQGARGKRVASSFLGEDYDISHGM